jgi:UDP-glucose 4-epimerase
MGTLIKGNKVNKRCVVLGGCGFLGSVLTRRLVADGWTVRVFDKEGVDTWRLQSVLPHIELMTGDFMNVADLSRAIDNMQTVLHFIGTTIPQSSMDDIQFDIETNVVSTVRLLELMRERKGQRLVYASSGGTVYGISSHQRPLLETDPTEPIASYGVSKLTIEKYIRLFSYNYGLPYVVLRLANPYGESQSIDRPQGAVGVFLHKALSGEEISIWGDGSVVRDYIYEADVATVTSAVLATKDLAGVYNVGSGIGLSLNGLLETIREVTGRACPVSYDPSRKFDVPFNVLDINKIKQASGWSPRFTLAEGLKQMLSA